MDNRYGLFKATDNNNNQILFRIKPHSIQQTTNIKFAYFCLSHESEDYGGFSFDIHKNQIFL